MQVRVDRLTATHEIDGVRFARKAPSTMNRRAGWSVTLVDGTKRWFPTGADVEVGGYVDRFPAGRTASVVKGDSVTYGERQDMTVSTVTRMPHSRKTRYALSGSRATNDRYCRG